MLREVENILGDESPTLLLGLGCVRDVQVGWRCRVGHGEILRFLRTKPEERCLLDPVFAYYLSSPASRAHADNERSLSSSQSGTKRPDLTKSTRAVTIADLKEAFSAGSVALQRLAQPGDRPAELGVGAGADRPGALRGLGEGRVTCRERLGGVLRYYYREAA